MKNTIFTQKRDEWYTPKSAITMILKYLPKGKIIWCPFDKKESNYVKVLTENGFKVVYSHIEDNKDFFKGSPTKWDIIVSNPPFSLFTEILERCYKFNKPFLLLGTFMVLGSNKRFKIFKENNIQIFLPANRICFETKIYNDKFNRPNFKSIYLGWKIFPKEINYEKN